MKKVLFTSVLDSFMTSFNLPLLKWFKEQGYEVHVATNGNEEIPYCDVKHKICFERSPFKLNNLKAIKELKKVIDKEKFEIIHCHTPMGSVVTRIAAIRARKNGTRVIYTAHGFHFYKGAPKVNWLIYYPIEKIMAKYTDCLITINHEDYEFAKRHLKPKKIEHVNGAGLDTERLKENISEKEKKEKRKEIGIKYEDIVLTYVAELNKNKNQALLINVVEKLKIDVPNIKLILVGEGIYKQQYINMVKEKNLDENVKILGKRNDINEILSITDIYVASSIREGLPVNIMEAMYKGLPIVATNNRGHKELIIDNETGYIVDVKKQDLMIDRIFELINNSEKMSEFGNKGKLLVDNYQRNNILKEMEKIYNNER